jgi:hypothetical protein
MKRYLSVQDIILAEWCFIAGFAAGGVIVGIINLIYLAYTGVVSWLSA